VARGAFSGELPVYRLQASPTASPLCAWLLGKDPNRREKFVNDPN
jgi:hypothetical protein